MKLKYNDLNLLINNANIQSETTSNSILAQVILLNN